MRIIGASDTETDPLPSLETDAMNIAAAYNMTPAADKPWTREDDIRSSMGLCALLLARGMLYVQSVTASRVWPLAKAQEKLDAARGHYVTAKKRGATDARLAQLAADGLTLAAAIKAAEVIAAPALARNAERAKAKAAAAAERPYCDCAARRSCRWSSRPSRPRRRTST